jgi:hypothetical protein
MSLAKRPFGPFDRFLQSQQDFRLLALFLLAAIPIIGGLTYLMALALQHFIVR